MKTKTSAHSTPTSPDMRVLGIDPGFADMGFGLIESSGGKNRCLAYGSVQTKAGTPMPKRLLKIHQELTKIIAKYRPERIGIEKLFFSTNAKTAMAVAEARGVIQLTIEQSGIPCMELHPSAVKIAVCGHGSAQKKEVQKMTQILLALKEIPKPDDAADALAIAVAVASTRIPKGN